MDKELLIWTAGIIDGEGNIDLIMSNHERTFSPRLRVEMTHRLTVKRIHSILKLGSISDERESVNLNANRSSIWLACGADAVYLSQCLLPYLFTKKRQAEILVEFSKVDKLKEPGTNQLEHKVIVAYLILHDEMRELNKKGK